MRKRQLIGLMGAAGCGKDECAKIMALSGWQRLAFADALKAEAIDAGWSGRKDDEGRRFLQELGVKRREKQPNYWIRKALDKLDTMGDKVVFTDVRFLNEVQMIRDRGGLIWRIERPGVGPCNNHVSEHEWRSAPYDALIPNEAGLAALRIVVEHHLHRAGL